jgi:hypothetical protein
MKSAMIVSSILKPASAKITIRKPMSDTKITRREIRRGAMVPLQSPVVAEGDAVMMKFSLGRAAGTIGNSRVPAMTFCR